MTKKKITFFIIYFFTTVELNIVICTDKIGVKSELT